MKHIAQTILAAFAFLIVACGPSKEEKAKYAIEHAKIVFASADTLNAIESLDSLIKISNDIPEHKAEALKLRKNYYREIVLTRKSKIDSTTLLVESLSKNFIKEKEEFDRYTLYVPKRQTQKRSWDRSFIEVHLDERGALYLSSNYVGDEWLDHTGLRVYDSGDQAKTEQIPLGNVNNHHSDFMEMRWEKVNYKDGKSDAVIKFISENTERNLKAVFIGKRYHYILLESYDKEAVKDALKLSKALKLKAKYEGELIHFRKRMNKFH